MIPLDVRLDNFLGVVEFVADELKQRAVWIDGDRTITSIMSFDELMCQYFDDNDMSGFINEELSTSPLSAAEKEAIIRFSSLLETVGSLQNHSNRQTIKTPEWKNIIRCAQDTLEVFATRRRTQGNEA